MSNKNENMKIKGVKMFQSQFDFLRLYQLEYTRSHDEKKKLSAASISCFILLHFYCDDFGRIPADEFNLKNLTKVSNLPYSSIHKGFHQLQEHGFILSEVIEDREHYSIKGYAESNSRTGNLNYFLLPYALLESDFLAISIRARDAHGIIGALELFNGLSREYQKGSKEKAQYRLLRSLMQRMKKSVRNIMSWVKRIQSFLKVAFHHGGSIEKSSITVDLTIDCFTEVKGPQKKRELAAAVIAEITEEVTHLPVSVPTATRINATNRFIYEVVEFMYWTDEGSASTSLRMKEIINEGFDNLKSRLLDKSEGLKPIKNPLGYWINLCRKQVKEWYEEVMYSDTKLEERLNLNSALLRGLTSVPPFLRSNNKPVI